MPKGVRVTHGNVANILLTEPMSLGMRPGVRVSHILSVAFDMGAWEMLGCLAHGAELIIRDRSIADAIRFAHVVIATPTMLSMVKSSEMGHVKSVAVAGEPCPCALAEEWGSFCTFYNACGPTEVTIVNTAKLFDDRATVLTIGKPTPNNTVYVLDAVTRLPCRIGEVGEMWGGGNCVTDGYLGNDDLTHERFLEDPFVERFVGEKIPRMYRTGDLGRWTEDGELEHFGRVDDQVKMKGFRVELDGISTVVEQTSGVSKAVVVKIDNRLVAFVTPMYVGESAVKASVISKMAYYCVPEQVVSLKEFPKTRNGKVDKRALVKAVTESEQSVIAVSEKKYLKHCATSTRSRTWLPQDFVWTIGIVLQNILLAMVGR